MWDKILVEMKTKNKEKYNELRQYNELNNEIKV